VDGANQLTQRIDELSATIDSSVSQLGSASAATVRALFATGAENVACPEWCAALAYDSANMKKLLRNCASLNARMDARARAVSSEIREQLNRIRMNRKIHNRYQTHGATAGMHINYRSK
jgi:predicted RNA-binding protein with PIN domain